MVTADAGAESEPPAGEEEGWARPVYQQRSRQQRDRLLKAGERVFAEQGFWQAHVADIAKRAGCSIGSFYRRFKDKETFFFSLQKDMAAHAEANILKFFEHASCETDPLPEVFLRLISNTARTVRGIEGYYRALFELSLRGQNVWPLMRRLERVEAAQIVDLLRRRGHDVTEDSVDQVHLVLRMVHGQIISLTLHGPGPYAGDDPTLHKELALMFLRYLQIDPGEAARAPGQTPESSAPDANRTT